MSELEQSRKPLASVPLQTFLYVDDLYQIVFFSLEFLSFLYKGYGLFYPPSSISLDVGLLFLFAFTGFARIHFGCSGNKTENPNAILVFIFLCFPCIFFNLYYMLLQTYVIILEIILNAVEVVFVLLELLFSLSAFLTFKNYEKNQ